MNKARFLDAAAVAEMPNASSTEIDQCYRFRSYRCLLHMIAMLRRPRTARFHWNGILRDLRGVQTRLCIDCSMCGSRSTRSPSPEMTFEDF
jgi:hypothetical protein